MLSLSDRTPVFAKANDKPDQVQNSGNKQINFNKSHIVQIEVAQEENGEDRQIG